MLEEQENLSASIRDAKAEALDVADRCAATKTAIAQSKHEAEQLRTQIVSAPEAAVSALAEAQAAVERARGRVTAAEAKAREQLGRGDALSSLEKEFRKATAVATEAQQAVAQRKEASGVLKLAQQRMQENEAEGYRIESEQQHLERTLATLAERQARLEQQGELKVSAAHSTRTALYIRQLTSSMCSARQQPQRCALQRRRRRRHGSAMRLVASAWRPMWLPLASWRCAPPPAFVSLCFHHVCA